MRPLPTEIRWIQRISKNELGLRGRRPVFLQRAIFPMSPLSVSRLVVVSERPELVSALHVQVRDLQVALDVCDPEEALAAASLWRDEPVCVIVEDSVSLSCELLSLLRQAGHPWPVMLVTAKVGVPAAVEAMKQGLYELLVRPYSPSQLLAALQAGLTAAERMHELRLRRAGAEASWKRLSCREREAALLISTGIGLHAVAGRLGVCDKTVEFHLGRVYRELQVAGAVQLTRALAEVELAACRSCRAMAASASKSAT